LGHKAVHLADLVVVDLLYRQHKHLLVEAEYPVKVILVADQVLTLILTLEAAVAVALKLAALAVDLPLAVTVVAVLH
jgi:hypothetical protein